MWLLALLAVGMVCVVADYACSGAQGAGIVLRDSESVARARPRRRQRTELSRLGRYSLAVC
jgi:hypothetical protein